MQYEEHYCRTLCDLDYRIHSLLKYEWPDLGNKSTRKEVIEWLNKKVSDYCELLELLSKDKNANNKN